MTPDSAFWVGGFCAVVCGSIAAEIGRPARRHRAEDASRTSRFLPAAPVPYGGRTSAGGESHPATGSLVIDTDSEPGSWDRAIARGCVPNHASYQGAGDRKADRLISNIHRPVVHAGQHGSSETRDHG